MIPKRWSLLLKLSNTPSNFFASTRRMVCKQFHCICCRSTKLNTPYPQSAQPYRTIHTIHSQNHDFDELNEPLEKGDKCHESVLRKRFSDATKVQRQTIFDFTSRTQASSDDWNNLLENVFQLPYGNLNPNNIHGAIMATCRLNKNLNLAKNYLRFMKETGKKFNQVVIIEFITLCHYCETSLTEEDSKIVEYFTNFLLSTYPIMENKLGKAAVRGLSLMEDWKRCLEVVENLEKNVPVLSSTYSILIECLLRNDRFELARGKLLQCLRQKHELDSQVYIRWMEVNRGDSAKLQELLTIFRDYNVIPKQIVCERLIEAFSQLPPEGQLRGTFTRIHPEGRCRACNQKLIADILTRDEFQELRDEFINRVLVGSDVFKYTTPTELEKFFKFVKLYGPFDVVVDGLNVIYGGNEKSKSIQALNLSDTVDYFFRRDKKSLVIGRQHLRKLPARIFENVKEKSAVFLINDMSEDDPFTICATLYSGPHCVFVSRDFLRKEKFRLGDDRLSDIFRRWRLSHQLVPKKKPSIDFELPLRFKICTQNASPQSWHVPYWKDSDEMIATNWLCLRR